MDNQIDLELYKKAITRLNTGFSKTGTLIQNNARFLAHNMRKEEVEYSINRILPDFKKSYEEINQFYKDLLNVIENNIITIEEIKPFLDHVLEMFPQYLNDLNKTIETISTLKINTKELILNLEKIIKLFENILQLSEKTLKEKEL